MDGGGCEVRSFRKIKAVKKSRATWVQLPPQKTSRCQTAEGPCLNSLQIHTNSHLGPATSPEDQQVSAQRLCLNSLWIQMLGGRQELHLLGDCLQQIPVHMSSLTHENMKLTIIT